MVFVIFLIKLFQGQCQSGVGIAAGRRIFEMSRQQGQQMSGENLRTNKGNHQPLKGIFPLVAMGFDVASKFFESHQMRNFVNQGYQELVFVQTSVDRNFVFAAGSFSIIAVTGHALIHDFEMHLIDHNQFKNWFYGMFRQIFWQGIGQLWILNFGFWILEFGFWNLDFGFWNSYGFVEETCSTFPL